MPHFEHTKSYNNVPPTTTINTYQVQYTRYRVSGILVTSRKRCVRGATAVEIDTKGV